MKLRDVSVVLLALLLAAMAMVPIGTAADQIVNSQEIQDRIAYFEKARQNIVETHGAEKTNLRNLNTVNSNYPMINKKIIGVKILDEKTNDVYSVYLDDGLKIVDPQKFAKEEERVYVDTYGKLEPELKEKVTSLKADERINVWIWLKEPNGISSLFSHSEEKINEPENLARERKLYQDNSREIVSDLRSNGYVVNYISEYSPSFFAELSKDMITELEKNPNVTNVYLSRTYELELYNTAQTVNANPVWNAGYMGNGVQIAVVENDGIDFSNPYLADGTYFNSSYPNIGTHATAVAGIIGSTHSTNKGIAYGTPALLSANAASTNDADVIAATEWAISNYASILQNSWGESTGSVLMGMDRYFDHVSWSNHKTIVVSAGNRGYDDARVTSPAKAYNVISVGAFLDQDTPYWYDDSIAEYSSYVDPSSTNGDREKPEVVAVSGQSGSTTTDTTSRSYPWIDNAGSGTSFAAPVISGEAALLMQRQPQLSSWPETVKAIIMSSAVHNIHGVSRLSEKDGAGGVDVNKAFGIANNNQFQSNTVTYGDLPLNYYVNAQAGQKVRAAISWNSLPDDNHFPINDVLNADLDLVVFGPTDNFVTNSNSYDNNYEIVEFTAPTTGQYRIQNTMIRFDGTTERVGFAYCYA
jgi:hypothetical protein